MAMPALLTLQLGLKDIAEATMAGVVTAFDNVLTEASEVAGLTAGLKGMATAQAFLALGPPGAAAAASNVKGAWFGGLTILSAVLNSTEALDSAAVKTDGFVTPTDPSKLY